MAFLDLITLFTIKYSLSVKLEEELRNKRRKTNFNIELNFRFNSLSNLKKNLLAQKRK